MALSEKVFEAKMYNMKSQIDGLMGLVKRGRLKQTDAVDELSVMTLEISQAIQQTEPQQP